MKTTLITIPKITPDHTAVDAALENVLDTCEYSPPKALEAELIEDTAELIIIAFTILSMIAKLEPAKYSINPCLLNPHILIAPNKHNTEEPKVRMVINIELPTGANIAKAEEPINPNNPPNTPKPEPIKVKIHNTVKKVGLAF